MSIEDALQRIRGRYADHLHSHRTHLSALVQDALDAADPEPAITEIRFRAHKISGTAATLGFRALGETAAFCEQSADACLASKVQVGPVLTAADHLIVRIDEAIQAIG